MVVPTLLIGLSLSLVHGLRSRPRSAVGAAVASLVLAALIPADQLRSNASLQAPSLVTWLLFGRPQVAIACGAAILAVCFVVVRVRPGALWIALGVLFATGAILTSASSFVTARTAAVAGIGAGRGWLDSRVAGRGPVAVLWDEPGMPAQTAQPEPWQRVVWDNEFFSRSPLTVYALGAQSPEPVPEVRVRLSRGGVVVRAANGLPIHPRYVLTCGLRLMAPIEAIDRATSAVLYRVDGHVQVGLLRPSTCQGGRNPTRTSSRPA
jgi:hypothetical protein